MTLAWRLQTLAAAHGIEMFVPQHGNGTAQQGAVSVHQAVDRADCVLAIITSATDQFVQNELGYALERNKVVIPIVSVDLEDRSLLRQFPRVFWFSPEDNPGAVESEIVEFLKEQQLSKDNQRALGALAGLGLSVLFSLQND